MANQFGGLVADIPGSFERGRQFRQAELLRPGQLEQQQLGTQRAQQQLVTGGLQQQAIQQGIETEAQKAKSQNLFNTVARLRLAPDADKGAILEQNIIDVESRNGDATESRQALDLFNQGRVDELNQSLDILHQQGVQTGFLKAGFPGGVKPTASQQDFETFQKLQKTDPEAARVFGRQAGFIRETPEKLAEIEVSKTQRKERVKLKEKRASDITSELSTQGRQSKRSLRKISEASRLADRATQGVGGNLKIQLARLFPGIDASNESALTSAFKNLALDELQKFKGPTTDFEFRVTEDIAGSLGQGKSANIARLSSLARAAWFNGREAQQFRQHVDSGGDPDTFSFNFGEPVKTRKGVFTLQDLQDTAVDNNITVQEVLKRLNQ